MSQIKHRPSTHLKAFRFISKLNALVARGIEGVHSAVFMGLIDDSVFQAHDTYPYGDWLGASEVSDSVKAVEDWLEVFISEHISPDSRVLVVSAGGGKELLKVRETGCSVVGVEFDETLCNKTREMLAATPAGKDILLSHAARYNLNDEAQDYDVVIVPRFFTSYIQGREERVRFLVSCRERLKGGGVIAFDFFTRPESERSPGSLIFRFQPAVSNLLRFLRGGKKRKIEVGDHLDPQVPLLHHHYNRAGLSCEIKNAGLSSVEEGGEWYGWVVAQSVHPVSTQSQTASVSEPVVEAAHS